MLLNSQWVLIITYILNIYEIFTYYPAQSFQNTFISERGSSGSS